MGEGEPALDRIEYSVVIPMYRSEYTIERVVDEVVGEFARIGETKYEIILVNDCSPDDVLIVARSLVNANDKISVVDLAKNVGQTNACLAGYSLVRGNYVISMDDDLQTPGCEIGALINAIQTRGDDIVFASYDETGTKRSWLRRLGTRLNWRMAEIMTGKPKGLETNSFLIMRRFVADALVAYESSFVYAFGVMFEVTDRVSNLQIEHRARAVGQSGYTMKKLFRLWMNGFLSFSMKPLRLSAVIGAATWLISLVGLVVSISVSSSFGVLLWAILFGLSLEFVFVWLLGEYLGRLYISSSKLPNFTIREIQGRGGKGAGKEPR